MRTHYGPWQPCWISNQHQKHKSGRGPSSEHFWQVWLKSVQRFQRRRFKCEKLTDGRKITHDKSSHGLWPGELKIMLVLLMMRIWRWVVPILADYTGKYGGFFNKYTNFNELSPTRHEINKWKIWHMILYKYIQWNLSNPTYQGTREMCRTVQDVRTCLILHTKGPGKCVGLYRMSEPV